MGYGNRPGGLSLPRALAALGVLAAVALTLLVAQGESAAPQRVDLQAGKQGKAKGACADDRSILTYSQSENPDSPYWADQTRMFSNKEWVDPAFCEDEVQAQLDYPGWSSTTIEDCLPGAAGCKPDKGEKPLADGGPKGSKRR